MHSLLQNLLVLFVILFLVMLVVSLVKRQCLGFVFVLWEGWPAQVEARDSSIPGPSPLTESRASERAEVLAGGGSRAAFPSSTFAMASSPLFMKSGGDVPGGSLAWVRAL